MSFIQILLIAIGLAMDAFAVSICKGLKMQKVDYKYSAILSAFFGIFQAIMPFFGWFVGIKFARYIEFIDHWLAFILLTSVGGKMVCEAFENKEALGQINYDYKEMFALAIATSIDALAVGIMFAMLEVNIIVAILIIGIVAYIFSFLGVLIGNRYGIKYKKKAEIAGGLILIFIGLKILLEDIMI